MESILTRNEKIFITIGVLTITSFLLAFNHLSHRPKSLSEHPAAEVINYKMARAEEGYSGYSLDGRDIEDQYQGIKAKNDIKKVVAIPTLTKGKGKPGPAATKTPPTKTKSVAAAQSEKTKPASIYNSHSQNQSKSENPISNAPQLNSNSVGYKASADTAETKADNRDSKGKTKKSFSQWRQEIFSNPTKETLAAFISAFRQKDLTLTEFQSMAQDLMDQEDMNLKGLGLMALRAQPSLASLSQLAHVRDQLPAVLQAYIDQAYLAYVQPQNVQYLNQALQTQDKKIIVTALNLLSTNIPKIKNGDLAGFVDPRHLRETDTTPLSLTSFQFLLPTLAQISSAQDPVISPLAAQVSSLIETTRVAGL